MADPVALVTTSELAAKLPFVMSADEEREAEGVLEYLSDDARHYGTPAWSEPSNTPSQVKNLILRAAVRFLKNPDGFVSSRAGDEAVAWTDLGPGAGSAEFTEAEKRRLEEWGGHRPQEFYTVDTYAYSKRPAPNTPGLVPVAGSTSYFPMFSSDQEPW